MTTLFGAEITLKKLAPKLKKLYQSPLRSERAVFLHGPPGIGKTSVTKQVAAELQIGYIWNNLVHTDYIQLAGLPDKEEGRARGLKRPFRMSLIDIPDSGEGLLIFDDFTHTQREIQTIGLSLPTERKINDSPLGPGWLLIFCGNETGGVFTLQAGIANRFAHFYVVADLESWKEWALKNNVRPEVVSFLESSPESLSAVPQMQEMAYPTPRSWERVSKDINNEFKDKPLTEAPIDDLNCLCTSEVGPGPAASFIAHVRTYGFVDFQEILSGTFPSLRDRAVEFIKGRKGAKMSGVDQIVQALSFSVCAHARAWWNSNDLKAEKEASAVGKILHYLEPSFGSMLLRDFSFMNQKKAFKLAELSRSKPQLSHVLSVLENIGKVQAGHLVSDLPDEPPKEKKRDDD